MIEATVWELQEMLLEMTVMAEHGRTGSVLLRAGFSPEEVDELVQQGPGPGLDAVLLLAERISALEARPRSVSPDPAPVGVEEIDPAGQADDNAADGPLEDDPDEVEEDPGALFISQSPVGAPSLMALPFVSEVAQPDAPEAGQGLIEQGGPADPDADDGLVDYPGRGR